MSHYIPHIVARHPGGVGHASHTYLRNGQTRLTKIDAAAHLRNNVRIRRSPNMIGPAGSTNSRFAGLHADRIRGYTARSDLPLHPALIHR